MSDPGVTGGEVGGYFAGAVALLAVIGKGIKWLTNFKERQAESRAAKLQAWHDELQAREKRLDDKQAEYQADIERRLRVVMKQSVALRMAFEMVAAPLRAIDPANKELAQAEQLLRSAFPLDPDMPPDFGMMLSKIELAASAAE